jgi:hypothetical protein
MAEKTKIGIYDDTEFTMQQKWNVPTTSDDIEILYMAVSQDQQKIGVALGKTIIKDQQKVHELCVYKYNKHTDKFELEKLRDFEYHEACITFQFNNKNTEELLFFTTEELFKLNYLDEGMGKETIYTFSEDNILTDQPRFGVFSKDQRQFILTSSHDILYVDMNQKNE